jgi:Ni2+-binding GTPase involved in maturation of urease and hydrogenase
MKLVLTGGFLGSGKTTAITEACKHLMSKGKRVAVITNDQGDQQVDSAFTKSLGINTREVSNGCFCCRYDELEAHINSLKAEHHPDVVFAESVGSCTDLVATIAKPLRQFNPEIKVTISIFADASLLSSILEGQSSFFDESVRYIYKKQLEEGDLIILNKIDLLSREQISLIDRTIRDEYPGKKVIHQSSLERKDVLKWLDEVDGIVLGGKRTSLTLDYDVYGDGEAKLAWLDERLVIHSPLGHAGFAARQIIRSIFNQLKEKEIIIGHLKFFAETDRWSNKISMTSSTTSADFRMSAEDVYEIILLINARVQTDPATLQNIVDQVIDNVGSSGSCTIITEKLSSFKPGYPQPTHRMGN